MISVIPPGERDQIAIIGKDQGYLGLAVHYGIVIDPTSGAQTTEMRTAWQPTQKELKALNAGASIIVSLINLDKHPPIMLSVSDTPD